MKYNKAQQRWNRFWCRDAYHRELAAYRATASPAGKTDLRDEIGAPPDPDDFDALAENYEDAMVLVKKYRESLLCLITDVKFSRGGKVADDAGFSLVSQVREEIKGLPTVIQSSDTRNSRRAASPRWTRSSSSRATWQKR